MVYAEATSVLPLIVSYVYHKRAWETRRLKHWSRLFPATSPAAGFPAFAEGL
jgi:deoxyhypusine synthase